VTLRVFLAVAVAVPRILAAQQTPTLDAVVIVAERAATPMNRSTAAVTRLTAADLARLPYATLADVLRQVPGFAVVDFDGLGRDPQLMVRGFYGGGEAEYVTVMVDGRAVNQAHNGTVPWETLPPLSSIESIEIVRGSASALHGDAAVAGVINIVTKKSSAPTVESRAGAESFGGVSAFAGMRTELARRDFSASLGFECTDGFRHHAERTAATGAASLRFSPTLSATARGTWRDFEDPGPLLERFLQDGTESHPLFASDGGTERDMSLSVDQVGSLGAGSALRTNYRFGARRAELVRSLALTPDFGDTRERDLRTRQLGVSSQTDLNPTILPVRVDRVSVGATADVSYVKSLYFSRSSVGDLDQDADGRGRRVALAAYAHFVASPEEWLRWTVGARADYMLDRFEDRQPTRGEPVARFNEKHFAFSPKAGVNVRYAPTGHAWISVSQTFKVPTFDQLFDQRPIPIPTEPFEVSTSNPELDPQRGTSVETGIYHDALISSARLGLTLTFYQIAMRDELDFDIQTFRYVNLARSRHRGMEAGLTLSSGFVSAYTTATLQNTLMTAGPNTGNQLKAVPGQVFAAGVTVAPPRVGTATVSITQVADMFIDDANTRRIASWARVDAQLSRTFGSLAVVVGTRNVLDERYNSTGFLDPAGTGEAYYYPAAGRVVTLGVRYGR
jgi:outer membrane cobalamin receptor